MKSLGSFRLNVTPPPPASTSGSFMLRCLLGLTAALSAAAGFAQAPYPGYDSEHGPVTPGVYIASYTGNVHVGTRDLAVAGAVGQHGLGWQRYGNSRTTGATLLFGSGHNWSHNWQWELVEAAPDDQGRAALAVHEPAGAVHRFIATAPGAWQPEAAISQEIVSDGTTFRLLLSGGGEVRFVRQDGGRKKPIYQLQEMLDDAGNRWTLAWQDGRLAQVNEPAGRWLKISYTALAAHGAARGAKSSTVISEVTASDGQRVRYDYEFIASVDYPVLTGVTYPDDTRAAYAYTAPRPGDRLLLEQAVDPRGTREMRGRAIRYRTEPDAAAGQVAQVETADGKGIFDVLSADGAEPRSYALKLPNGGAIGTVFHRGGKPTEEIDAHGFAKKHEYGADGRGFKTATTDELGRVTRFENDAKGHIVKTTFPDGSTKTWQRDARGRVLAETDELGQTRRYTRDTRGRVTRVQHPDGSAEEMTYNDFGQALTRKDRGGAVTTMTYDARALLTKTTNAVGAVTTLAYDARDRVASTTDARGNTTRYERDAAGRVTKTIYADGTTTTNEYNDFGHVTKTVDASGAVHRMNYDNLGRMISIIDTLGRETRTEYAPIGETAPWARPVRTITASGRVTAMTYDAAGRVIARTTAAGTQSAATTRTAYDAAGRQISVTNPLGQTVQFFYDERGRRIKTMSALNYATTLTYDASGRMLSETDAKGNTSRWTYDAVGRELTKTDAKDQVTRREYDVAGRLVALTDAKLNTYRFEYDLLGRQTALVYPDGSRETTAYDAAGLKVSFTNRAGTVQTFTYDNRNREIGSEWSDGSQKIVKAYDVAGRMTLQDNGVSKLTFAYDEVGRLASETQDLSPVVADGAADPSPRTVSYTYNADGQRETLGYPDGSFVKFAYNARGQLAEILGDGIPPPIASYEYDAAGNATLMPRENQTESAREFDAENKTLAITERAAGRRSPLSQLDYLYDEAGNRTATLAAVDANGRGTAEETLDTYRYDETYQVTGADYGAKVGPVSDRTSAPALTEKFTYDAVGNRIDVGRVAPNAPPVVTRYAVNNLNQYTQVGEFAPTHDRNGNLSGMGQWLYRYDAMNRLVSATNGATTARFFYDAKNRCVARNYTKIDVSPSTSTLALNTYDNWNLIEERDGFGAQQARYVHGRRIDEIIVMVNRHGTFYPHHDALGNITMLTGKDGRLVERYDYSVTGQVAISDASGHSLTGSGVDNRWLFTGREWLQEVGLYDYRNRVYSAELGRFLQTDPIRFDADDVNIYRYVHNAFTGSSDPTGLAELIQYIYNDGSGYAHAFTQGTYDSGTQFVKGNYPDGVRDDTALLESPNTTILEAHSGLTNAQVGQAGYYINTQNGLHSATNHCGNTADNAVDYAGAQRTGSAAQTVQSASAFNLWNSFVSWLGNLFE